MESDCIRCREGESAVLMDRSRGRGDVSRKLVKAALDSFCDENCEGSCRRLTMSGVAIGKDVQMRLRNASEIIYTGDKSSSQS